MFLEYPCTITFEDAFKILNTEPKVRVSRLPVYQPSGGEIYLYDTREFKKDCYADGYLWRNRGRKIHPYTGVHKRCFNINRQDCSTGFQRYIWNLSENDDFTIVQYVGDKSLYVAKPHGNSKSSEPYMRAPPSFKKKAMQKLKTRTVNDLINEIERESDDPKEKEFYRKNKKNLSNYRSQILAMRRLTQEDFWGAYEAANDKSGFVKNITLFPQFLIIAGNVELLNLINDILRQQLDSPIMFCFDTSCVLGHYSVSLLVCKHPAVLNNQIIPVACVLHGEKFSHVFEYFLRQLCECMPQLSSSQCVFIIDNDETMNQSIYSQCYNVHVVHCWDKIKHMYKYAGRQDKQSYVKDISRLLNSENVDEFDRLCESIAVYWPRKRHREFEASHKNNILHYAAKFVLLEYGIYDAKCGVRKFHCDEWNRRAKALVEADDFSPASMMNSFKQQQQELMNTILQTTGIVNETEMSVDGIPDVVSIHDTEVVTSSDIITTEIATADITEVVTTTEEYYE